MQVLGPNRKCGCRAVTKNCPATHRATLRPVRAPTVRVRAEAPPFRSDDRSSSATLEKPASKVAAPPAPAPPPPPPSPSPPSQSPPQPQSQSQPQSQPSSTPSPETARLFPRPGDPKWPPQRPFAAVLLDNLVDSGVDIERHLRRMRLPEEDYMLRHQEEQLVKGDGGRMRLRSSTKPVVLVLGSGWGAHSLIKVIDTDSYDVVVVSPRNHFVFTPMLPSTAVGTVEFRSLLEPIRTSNPCVTYLEAECDQLDPEAKVAVCTSKFCFTDGHRPQFEIQYDKAVIAVGEQPNTFGVPGVREHAFFMKEISDAVALRSRIAEKFELASLPGTTEEQRYAALRFVVVGGGPTGVEFAGTLSDFLREDLRRKYPAVIKYVRMTLLQNVGSILTQFDSRLQRMAAATLESQGVEVRTNVAVVGITADKVILQGGEELEYGVCLWSAGNAPRPLVRQVAAQVPDQALAAEASRISPGSKLCVDSFLRVVGASDLMALGDCSLVLGNRLPPTAQVAGQQGAYLAHLINSGYCLGAGGYTRPPPFQVVKRNRLQRMQAESEANALQQWLAVAMAGGPQRIEAAAMVSDALFRLDAPPWVRVHSEALTSAPSLDLEEDPDPSAAGPEGAAGTSTSTTRPAAACDIAAVAAAAAAAGGASPESVARAAQQCLASVREEEEAARRGAEAREVRYWDRPFEFLSLGIMAYVGSEKALTQVEAFDVVNLKLHGTLAFALWKSVYITKQVSFRNRVLILFDWMKARVFGRDISLF